jgi:translation elongation factor EF-G
VEVLTRTKVNFRRILIFFKGVQPLLDAMVDFLPSPVETTVPTAKNEKGEEIKVPMNENDPLCALAFKVINHTQMGLLVFLRVYSGTLKSRSLIHNSSTGNSERITKLLQMQANIPQEITSVSAGNIAVAVGLKNTSTGNSLFLVDFRGHHFSRNHEISSNQTGRCSNSKICVFLFH